MIGLLVTAAVGIVGTLCSTARDMYSDNLISKKELAEIEAKSKAFTAVVEYETNKVNNAFELELKEIELRDKYIGDFLDKIIFLIEKLDTVEEGTRFTLYYNQISTLQDSLNELITSDPKYFTNELIEKSKVQMIDTHHQTQIGVSSTNYSSSDLSNSQLLSGSEVKIPIKHPKSK